MDYRVQLAALQVDFICKTPTPSDVRRSPEALLDTLKGIYGEIYKRIPDQKGSAPRLALGAFRCIRCSYKPLCSETLLDAITVEIDDDGEFSCEEDVIVDILLKICQNFLIFDKRLNVFRSHIFLWTNTWRKNWTMLNLIVKSRRSAFHCCARRALGILTTKHYGRKEDVPAIAIYCYTQRCFGHGTFLAAET